VSLFNIGLPNITSPRYETYNQYYKCKDYSVPETHITNVVLKEHLLTWKKAIPIPRPISTVVSSFNHFSRASKHPCNRSTAF
jgi:hypothetical protein